MSFPRCSGILLHPSSLPGPFGIGDLGPPAHHFAGLLAEAGQKIWQILPLGPTGKNHSPYKCLSSFAGNPLLISPLLLREHGYLSKKDLARPPGFPPVATVVWANNGGAKLTNAKLTESTKVQMRGSWLAAILIIDATYGGSPMRRRNSLNRGSERRGANQGSVLK